MKETTWPWASLEKVIAKILLPEGVTLKVLRRDQVVELAKQLAIWYPDIITGTQSCHLDPNFYFQETVLEGEIEDRQILPCLFIRNGEMVGIITLEKNSAAKTITSRVGALAPEVRGLGIAYSGPSLLEETGKAMGAGLAYYFATTKIPHQQAVAEKMGFQLVGIVPAYDLDTVAKGQALRVHECIYAKVLARPEECYTPPLNSLTPQTQRLWALLFGKLPEEKAK